MELPNKAATHLVRSQVSVQAVRDALASDTAAPSALGASLERAAQGGSRSTDYRRAQAAQEQRLLEHAAVIRCLDALSATPNLFRAGEACVTLRRFAKENALAEGAVVVAVLRAYEPWGGRVRLPTKEERQAAVDARLEAPAWVRDEARGLLEVHEWMRRQDATERAPVLGKEATALDAFRAGKAKCARDRAASMLADATLALDGFVKAWNARPSVAKAPTDAALTEASRVRRVAAA
jgi:hypothetical protein